MYGFSNDLIKNVNYRIEVGKFLISSYTNINALVRFSIIE